MEEEEDVGGGGDEVNDVSVIGVLKYIRAQAEQS